MGDEGFGEGLGDVLRGDEVNVVGETGFLDGACSGGTDGGDAFCLGGEAKGAGTVQIGMHGVGAGEEEPVEAADGGKGRVQRTPGTRGSELDGGDENGLGSLLLQQGGERRGLPARAGDEDATALQG